MGEAKAALGQRINVRSGDLAAITAKVAVTEIIQ